MSEAESGRLFKTIFDEEWTVQQMVKSFIGLKACFCPLVIKNMLVGKPNSRRNQVNSYMP